MILRKRIIHRKTGPSNSAEGLSILTEGLSNLAKGPSIFIESASIFPDAASISAEALSASSDVWAERPTHRAALVVLWATPVALGAMGLSHRAHSFALFFVFSQNTPSTYLFSCKILIINR